jgi:Protein of unknown function (DUF2442)
MMTKIVRAVHAGGRCIELSFSDGVTGVWDGSTLLTRTGSLVTPLHEAAYFNRFFTDAGALCWPNGLELSPERLREQITAVEHA